jgi:ergothioneine biosynthesis protein EgtB
VRRDMPGDMTGDMPGDTTRDVIIAERYRAVRGFSERLCQPLELEDYVVQSMPDASPVKWHLAHTSWFFETFVLEPFVSGYVPRDPQYRVLFNSYYQTVGPQFTRAERGLLTRPTVAEVFTYRRHIDDAVLTLLAGRHEAMAIIEARVELGLHHESQHQELLLTDLQHALSFNPLRPVYRPQRQAAGPAVPALEFRSHEGGLVEIGHRGTHFAFDNETPRHRSYVEPYQLASRLVTQGEYRAFIEDGGYARPELWLSEGFALIQRLQIDAPLYWYKEDGEYQRYSLHGALPIDPDAPVCHMSYYEADAYARWASARLPTEAEWELAYGAQPQPRSIAGQFVEDGALVPQHSDSGFGSTWTWTSSPYVAYPGFRAPPDALGEYNGKFMCDQWVLRGGSCFSPGWSLRGTYRNFFPASARWQVSGIRLASS